MPKNNPNCPLPDIREARIDPTLPVNERLRLFAAAIGDPHRFRVGDTEVEVLFDDSAPACKPPDRHVQTAAIVSKTG